MNNLNNIPGEILKTSQLPDDMPTHLVGVIIGTSPKTVKYSTTLFASQIASQMTNVVSTSFVYTDPTWLGSLNWNKIISTPSTILGYGITDAVSSSRTLSINGTTYDLTANRSWSVGDLLSSGSYSNPSWITGLAWTKITGAPAFLTTETDPIYTASSWYSTTNNSTNWNTAYSNRITSLTTTGSSGASTLVSNVLNIPNYDLTGLGGQPLNANLTSISALTYASTSFVKMTAAGTFALDTATYLTAESDTLASVTGRGNTTSATLIYSGTTESIRPSVDSVGTIGATNFRFGTAYIRAITSVNNSLDVIGSNINLNDSSGNIKLRVFGGTGNVVIQNGGTFTDAGFRLDVNGTARIQNQLTTTGSITAASAIARGVYMNQTLVAAANNDSLAALEINPTFTNGAFTGVKNNWINLVGNAAINGTNQIYLRRGDVDVFFASSAETQIKSISSTVPLRFFLGATKFAEFFATTGNLTLQNGGTFTDAGFRLDVVGADSRFNGIRAGLGAGQVATNTVYGNGAASATTTAYNNIFVGYNCATSLSTGFSNTLIGNYLICNGASNSNTAVGQDITATGFNNVIMGLGASTGVFNSSIILGRAATATASNQFVVGSASYNAGAVTTEVNTTISSWAVKINGTDRKLLLLDTAQNVIDVKQAVAASTTTTTVNWVSGNVADITLTSNTTFTLSNPVIGTYIIKLTQGGAGGFLATWPATIKWSGGIAPVLTTTAGKIDIITLVWDGTNYFGSYALNF